MSSLIGKVGRVFLQRPIYFILFPLLLSCGSGESVNRKVVARAGDQVLYEDELREMVPVDMTGQDSLTLVKQVMETWAREAVVLQKAENNLMEIKDIERKIRDYRQSLIVYAYEKALISQYLDTNVTGEDIEQYYKEHPESFTLKDNIIKVSYVKAERKAPELNKVKKWYRSDEESDRQHLLVWCSRNAANFFLDDTWLLFDDVLKEVPIKLYDKESFLQYNRFVEVQDSTYYYFLNIRGFRIKNTLSPLPFERENIRSLLLNKRKLELIARIKGDLYDEAVSGGEVEFY
ncbi:MAG: hypothetical protein IT233_04745 [Bacteroidia bacterium]|nr:hypothetical protein [Bacteroidia bacterium]